MSTLPSRPMPSRRLFSQALALAAALAASASIAQAAEVVRLGVTAGPHAQIAEVARKVAAADGLDIRIVEFQDNIQPLRTADKDKPWVKDLADAYRSREFLAVTETKFAGFVKTDYQQSLLAAAK